MTQLAGLFLVACLFCGCNQPAKQTTPNQADTTTARTDSPAAHVAPADSLSTTGQSDTVLARLSKQLLLLLKAKKYEEIATYIHPTLGVRFSPYGHVDSIKDKHLMAKDLVSLSKQKSGVLWGRFDGTGKPIRLNIDKYFEQFVYDEEYLDAKQQSTNKLISGGTSFDNLEQSYPGSGFTQYYFPGFDPKYDGMDWKSLVLVFKEEAGKHWLIAVIHDQWKI